MNDTINKASVEEKKKSTSVERTESPPVFKDKKTKRLEIRLKWKRWHMNTEKIMTERFKKYIYIKT